jgi:DNA-binding NarL/FixJ family response regulator
MKPITVLLAEDHTVVREGLRALLEAEGDIRVVGEASTGRQAVVLAQKLTPNVVVMDIAMPLLNGLEATRQIRKTLPDIKVLILSAHSEEVYIEQVLAMGAMGYLLKQTSAHVLSDAVRDVNQGKTFLCPTIQNRRRSAPVSARIPLSSRELEVLQLIAEGHANKQVAAELVISVKTVEKHRQRLMEKLNIHDTAGLTRHAIASGIIESSIHLTIT